MVSVAQTLGRKVINARLEELRGSFLGAFSSLAAASQTDPSELQRWAELLTFSFWGSPLRRLNPSAVGGAESAGC